MACPRDARAEGLGALVRRRQSADVSACRGLVDVERARLAAHASHKGSRDHEGGGVDGVAPCARAQGDAFGLDREAMLA
jgi:hypothetical protein